MTDYYTYSPNPVKTGEGNYFNLTYNAFEILRPIGIFTLYDSKVPPNQLSTYDPNSTFNKGSGLFNPVAMVFDSSGNLYALCDLTNVTNVNISTRFTVVKINSTATSGDILIYGTYAQVSSYGQPTNLTIDNNNNIYISFKTTGIIAKYNSSGVEQSGQSGKPFLSGINLPTNMTCDISNNLYVMYSSSGQNPNAINKYDQNGRDVTGFSTITFSGNEQSVDLCCNNTTLLYVTTSTSSNHNDVYSYNNVSGNASQIKIINQLNQSTYGIGQSLVYDKSQYLYLTTNKSGTPITNYFVKIDTNAATPSTPTISTAQNFTPDINSYAVAYNINNANRLYTLNNSAGGTIIYSLLTNFSGGSFTKSTYFDSSGNINYPNYIVYSNTGTFYVSDVATGKIFQTPQVGVLSTFLSGLNSPTGLTIYNNDLYVVTNIKGTTNVTTIYRCPLSTPNTPTIFATIHNTHTAQGIVINSAGTFMYIAAEKSTNNHATIYQISMSSPSTQTQVISDGANNIYYGISFDSTGNFYVALNNGYTSQGSIIKYNSTFTSSSTYFNTYKDPNNVTQNLINPTGIAFDALGNLYVASTNTDGNGIVVQNNLTSGITTLFAQSSNLINNPIGIALNVLGIFPTGNLYTACQNNSRIVQSATHNIVFTNIPSSTYIVSGINSLNIEDPYNLIGIYVNATCYRKGTKILTYNGYKKIEDLKPKDMLVTVCKISNKDTDDNNDTVFYIEKNKDGKNTFESELKPIIGIGSFKIEKTDEKTAPICIKKDAIKEDCPMNDIYVSPEHIVLFPERLDKAKKFINDSKTVYQDFLLRNIEYYHIELEDHSLIVAENMFAESFVTNGDKSMFEEWKTVNE